MKRLNFVVDWPPTANSLYATVGGRRVKSAAGRRYAKQVADSILVQCVPRHSLTGSLHVCLYLRPPREHNIGDIANREKALMDALVTCGVIEDDRFIVGLRIMRYAALPPTGQVSVVIQEAHSSESAHVSMVPWCYCCAAKVTEDHVCSCELPEDAVKSVNEWRSRA